MTLEQARDHLYGVTPQEFVAERNALARNARESGDRELAAAIAALRKPTVAAWLVNSLVRAHPDEITHLRALGTALREATTGSASDQLRALAPRQQQILHAMTIQARALATEAGIRVTQDAERDVEQTLRAALADDDAAARVATGALTDTLEYSGFPTVPAGPRTPVTTTAPARTSPKPGPKTSARDAAGQRREG